MPLVVRGKDLLFLRNLAPDDREVTFSFQTQANGLLADVTSTVGEPCYDRDGAWSNRCGVPPLHGQYAAHTHPMGNRVSSSDFVNAIQMHPHFGGTREVSAVLGPGGVFHYRPTPELLAKWESWTALMRAKKKDEWKAEGLRQQDRTQGGDVAEYVTYFQGEGFELDYQSWDYIDAEATLVLR